MYTYDKLIEEFKSIREAQGLSSQDVAGPKNCQVYSFEKSRRFIKAITLVSWLDKMGFHLEIKPNKK